MNSFEELLKALSELNKKLENDNIFVSFTVVGSMAIYLNDIKLERFTEDVDYINFDANEKFQKYVEDVAEKFKLKKDWINSRASSISPLPNKLKENLKIDNRFSNIEMKITQNEHLIMMKVYAGYVRSEEKDFEDLDLLKPKKIDIDKGIEYLKESIVFHHGDSRLKRDLEDIENYKESLYGRYC